MIQASILTDSTRKTTPLTGQANHIRTLRPPHRLGARPRPLDGNGRREKGRRRQAASRPSTPTNTRRSVDASHTLVASTQGSVQRQRNREVGPSDPDGRRWLCVEHGCSGIVVDVKYTDMKNETTISRHGRPNPQGKPPPPPSTPGLRLRPPGKKSSPEQPTHPGASLEDAQRPSPAELDGAGRGPAGSNAASGEDGGHWAIRREKAGAVAARGGSRG